MSIISKVTEAVVQFIPDRDRDTLSEAERLIGKPIDRLDGREKVTGAARFSAEFPLEKLAYAALAYSTIAKGTIKRIDTSEAEKAPGVIAVITHRNAPKMKDPPLFSPSGGSDAAGSKANVLNTDDIFWNGQPVAVIVAETLDRAEHAASLVKVEYRQETAATSFTEAKAHLEVPKKHYGRRHRGQSGRCRRSARKSEIQSRSHLHDAEVQP
jgi:xanthine dehydrogenase YagR molybdenum-binding subunit